MPTGIYERTPEHIAKLRAGHARYIRRNGGTTSTKQRKAAQSVGLSQKRHGMTGTRIHNLWISMRQRCNNSKASNYQYYGGRGITICKEWNRFENFRDWAYASGYTDTLSIDRINGDGNYEPSNCRWTTIVEQNRNRTFGRTKQPKEQL